MSNKSIYSSVPQPCVVCVERVISVAAPSYFPLKPPPSPSHSCAHHVYTLAAEEAPVSVTFLTLWLVHSLCLRTEDKDYTQSSKSP